ncbi:chondroitinase family polysaccharide lyase [Aquimarina algiphila]|uniref:chondroitinase family polysaccharide lyase n=1 Tax=Aquimarina algiphila TaxID=2047982 RepID=UPI00249154E4|nr:chondroitinase family polysaccharide lyase [Aquimarina algiphila]
MRDSYLYTYISKIIFKRNLVFFWICLLHIYTVVAQDQSFEGYGVPANWKASIGNLSISTSHYKLGIKSLKWDWSANDVLTVSNLQAEGLVPSEVLGFFKNMFRMWIYNNNAIPDENLEIEFYDNNNQKQFYYPFYLNFKGWRAASASYKEEMLGNKASSNITTLRIKAPNTGSGTLYFDFIDYTMDRNQDRSADHQLPFVNADNGKHWIDLFYLQSLPKTIRAITPSAQELKDFNIVKQKYDDFILGNKPSNSNVSQAVNTYNKLNIKYSGGIVTGKPIFGTDFKKSEKIHIIDNFIYVLAKDYKHKGTATSLAYFLNTVRYVLDQGYADGSLMETVHHIGYGFRNVSKSIHLMKDELVTTGLWNDARKMVEWYAATDVIWHPTAFDSNMDDALTRSISILGACLYKTTDEEKIQYLKGFKAYVEQWLTPFSRTNPNGVKIDYTGFHHNTYYPQYAFGAYKSLSQAINLMSTGVYNINTDKKNIFKKMLLVARVNMSDNNFSNGLSGRSPFTSISISETYKNLGSSAPVDTQLLKVYNTITGGDEQTNSYGTEIFPVGFWQVNYANLGTYRQKDWLAGIKGFSKHFWGTEIYSSDNRYGRYQSYGSIEILYPGGHTNSGLNIKGWNWNMTPGTTTIHLPFKSLKASKSRQDETTNSNFAASLRFGTKKDYYIEDKIEGNYGMFGMDFTQKAITPTHDASFTFKKSVFCFEGKIICLGSNINNNDTSNLTATNLFQNALNRTTKPIQINNKNIVTFPYNNTLSSSTNHWVIDAFNTGYYIKSGSDIVVNRKNQSSPKENGKSGNTSGDFASTYIDHGTSPKDAGYEYVIIPSTNKDDMLAFEDDMKNSETAFYEILQKNKTAHIIKYKELEGYAFFEAGFYENTTVIKSNDTPCLVMSEKTKNDLNITVVNPDLNIDPSTKLSEIKPVTLVLNGEWSLNSSSGGVVNVKINKEDETTIIVDTKDGLPIDIEMNKETIVSVEEELNNQDESIIIHPNPTDSLLNIDILNNAMTINKVNLIDETGKIIWQQNDEQAIDVKSYSKGIYFLRFESNKGDVLTKSIIIN